MKKLKLVVIITAFAWVFAVPVCVQRTGRQAHAAFVVEGSIGSGGGTRSSPNFGVLDSSGGTTGVPMSSPNFSATGGFVNLTAPAPSVSSNASFALKATWQMVSVPFAPNNTDPAAVFPVAPGTTVYRWDPAANDDAVFLKYRPVSVLTPGASYWVRVVQPSDVSIAGTLVTSSPFAIPLRAGWNQIGDPFQFNVDWNQAKVFYQGNVLTIDEANTQNLVKNFIWVWDPDTNSYKQAISPNGVLGSTRGYWVYSNVDTTLLVPRQISSGSPTKHKTILATGIGNWQIQLKAQAGDYLDDDNYFGQAEDSSDTEDTLDVPEPPGFGDYVNLYFPHPDYKVPGRYANDFKAKGEQEKTWEFTVDTSMKGHPVTLSWEALSLPEGVQVLLEDVEGRNTVSMVSVKSYSFKTDYLTTRHFKVRSGKNLSFGPLKLGSVKNFPNPSKNPHTKFMYKPESGQIATASIELYTLSGKLVVKIIDPTPSDGEYLYDIPPGIANGVYLYRVTISDGKETATKSGKMVILR